MSLFLFRFNSGTSFVIGSVAILALLLVHQAHGDDHRQADSLTEGILNAHIYIDVRESMSVCMYVSDCMYIWLHAYVSMCVYVRACV